MKPVFKNNDEKPTVAVSVRELCGFVLRRGDVKKGSGIAEMQNGSAIHRMIQEECKNNDKQYKAEVRLSAKLDFSDYIFEVKGNADGVSYDGFEYTIDEIKSVVYPLSLIDESFSAPHLAQAKCYAYMMVKSRELENINVRLIYYNVEDNLTREFNYSYTALQIKEFFYSLTQCYNKWALLLLERYSVRRNGVENMKFPFKKARNGQSDLMKESYCAISRNYSLYVNAPTGTGKTISTIYPAVLSLNKNTDKIFYLTAKTSTQNVVEEAFYIISGEKPFLKSVTISAKGKMCVYPNEKSGTYPCADCELGIDYYERINDAVYDIVTNEWLITSDVVRKYAAKHKVCPFEFSLDVSEWCDVAIGDYNYVFDPRAALKRYNDTGEKYVLLVDEAHNLVDRAREMYSASVKKEWFEAFNGKFKPFHKGLDELIKKIIALIKGIENDAEEYSEYVYFDLPETLYLAVNRLFMILQEILKNIDIMTNFDKDEYSALVELMLNCRHFINIATEYDKNYVWYAGENGEVKLFCVQPGEKIKKIVKSSGIGIFFSATLLPSEYFLRMLGCEDTDVALDIPSPFHRDNFLIMAYKLSTKYNDRDITAENTAKGIKAATSTKVGNYLVFFSSFSYMEKIRAIYKMMYSDQNVIVQARKMSSAQRKNYISQFTSSPSETLVGFAVTGGIFAEGIDLSGDRLSGVVIVGTGLPSPSVERSAVARYFAENDENGFDYSYFFPGMNRVFQAMGRVIRSETDRGFALLIDDRFLSEECKETFPPFWQDYKIVNDPKEIYYRIKEFL